MLESAEDGFERQFSSADEVAPRPRGLISIRLPPTARLRRLRWCTWSRTWSTRLGLWGGEQVAEHDPEASAPRTAPRPPADPGGFALPR